MDLKEVLKAERYELKYLIHIEEWMRLKYRLEQILEEDSHNDMEGYMVRSLYFDNIADNDYISKLNGEENRRKIRLRIYNPNSLYAKLEIKAKYGNAQKKESATITRETAEELIRCNYEVLLAYNTPFLNRVYRIMTSEMYRPVVVVEYKRLAYIHKENQIRLTLDSQLRSNETHFDIFSTELDLIPVMNEIYSVFEVKYSQYLYKWITDVISCTDKKNQSVSKYCICRTIMNI